MNSVRIVATTTTCRVRRPSTSARAASSSRAAGSPAWPVACHQGFRLIQRQEHPGAGGLLQPPQRLIQDLGERRRVVRRLGEVEPLRRDAEAGERLA